MSRATRRFNFHFHEWYTALREMYECPCVNSVSAPVQERLDALEQQIQDLQLLVEELFNRLPDTVAISSSPLPDPPPAYTEADRHVFVYRQDSPRGNQPGRPNGRRSRRNRRR